MIPSAAGKAEPGASAAIAAGTAPSMASTGRRQPMTPVELGSTWRGSSFRPSATPAQIRSAMATPSGAQTLEILLLTVTAPRLGSPRRWRPTSTGAPGKALRVKTAAKSVVGRSSASNVRVMRAGLATSKGVKANEVVATRKPAGSGACVASQARCSACDAKVSLVLATSAGPVGLDGRAGAHELPVAQHVVEACHRRPELVAAQPGQGVGGPLARVGVLPGLGQKVLRRVGGVLEQVVLARLGALLDLGDLLAD